MGRRVISLTTDFGLSDPYVGQLKAALLSLAPDASIVDLTHAVGPQAVREGAFVLDMSWRVFPEGSIHIVVVDPGVGTARKRLAMAANGHYFVGPDNGSLSAAMADGVRGLRGPDEGYEARSVSLPDSVQATSVDRLDALPRAPSATFEGRDVFAPVAALLASGRALDSLGPRMASVLAFPAFHAPPIPGGLAGVVMRVDRYGNLITDISGEDLRAGALVRIAGEELSLARTYGEASGLAAIIGSSGYLGIALPNGDAAAALAAGQGMPVIVRFSD